MSSQSSLEGSRRFRLPLLVLLPVFAGAAAGQSPVVTSVVDAYSGSPALSPGSIALITGSNLGTAPKVAIAGLTAYDLLLPATTGGRRMTVQIPPDAPAGATTLTVSLFAGPSSVPFPVTLTPYAPVLINSGSGSVLSPLHASNVLVTAGYPSAPGETVTVAAIGLGPAATPVGIGVAAPPGASLATLPTLSIGGNPLAAVSASLMSGQIGIDQVSFVVPAGTAAGTYPVTLSVGGFTSNALNLAVGPAPAGPVVTSVLDPVIGGATLCPSGIAQVSGINFSGDAKVTVGGEPAAIVSASHNSSQMLIQLPADLHLNAPTINASLTVTGGSGQTSPPFSVTVAPSAPVLYSVESGDPLAPAHQNTGAPVTNANPALPGESIVVYAINLGPTNPDGSPALSPSLFLQGQTPLANVSASRVSGQPNLFQIVFQIPAGQGTGMPLLWITTGQAGSGGQSNYIGLPTALTLSPPAITGVANNYSYTLPGVPGYGIAQGSIFDIFGANLAGTRTPLLNVPLQTGVSGVNVTVTVNGVSNRAPLYFLSPQQIVAILPSATPAGDGTVTVTTSAGSGSGPIHVVQSTFGILTLNGSSAGPAAAFDAGSNLLGFTNALNPGDYFVLWGTGAGPVSGDETVLQTPANLDAVPFAVEVGGLSAPVVYHGRSQFPGLDQVVAMVPAGVTPGCWVSVVARSGGNGEIVGNFATLPIASSGRTCSDAAMGLTTAQVQKLSAQPSFHIGILDLQKQVNTQFGIPGAPNESDTATAAFLQLRSADFAAAAFGPSVGSCLVTGAAQPPYAWGQVPAAWLDAGPSLAVSGAAGSASLPQTGVGGYGTGAFGSYLLPAGFPAYQNAAGAYSGGLDTGPSALFVPHAGGGEYTFANRTGGADIPAFQATIDFPTPLPSWPQGTALYQSAISLSRGLTLNWSGGDPNSFFLISGRTYGAGTPSPVVEFTCATPAAAGRFTIPSAVLQSLPAAALNFANPGSVPVIQIAQASFPRTFSATGLDFAFVQSIFSSTTVVSYQ